MKTFRFLLNFQISFMVPKDAIPGRLGLLLTLFLCAINTLNATQRSAPKSGGTMTAIIQWILACIGFIIMAIFEYAWILSHQKCLKSVNISQKRNAGIDLEAKFEEMSRRLDNIMLLISPPLFFTFAIAFWISKDQSWFIYIIFGIVITCCFHYYLLHLLFRMGAPLKTRGFCWIVCAIYR